MLHLNIYIDREREKKERIRSLREIIDELCWSRPLTEKFNCLCKVVRTYVTYVSLPTYVTYLTIHACYTDSNVPLLSLVLLVNTLSLNHENQQYDIKKWNRNLVWQPTADKLHINKYIEYTCFLIWILFKNL